MTSALDRTSVFVSSGSSEMSAPGFLVPLIVKWVGFSLQGLVDLAIPSAGSLVWKSAQD